MSTPEQPDVSAKGQFLVYRTEDGRTKIEVRLENETVWLTQQHMARLFQTTQQNISLHLQNIYDEGELQRAATPNTEYPRQRRIPPPAQGNALGTRPPDHSSALKGRHPPCRIPFPKVSFTELQHETP